MDVACPLEKLTGWLVEMLPPLALLKVTDRPAKAATLLAVNDVLLLRCNTSAVRVDV